VLYSDLGYYILELTEVCLWLLERQLFGTEYSLFHFWSLKEDTLRWDCRCFALVQNRFKITDFYLFFFFWL